jgi:hypothetical protein
MTLLTSLRVNVSLAGVARYERAVARLAAAARADSKTVEWRATVSQGLEGVSYAFGQTAASFAELATREPLPVLARRLLGESAGDDFFEESGTAVQATAFSVRRLREELSTITLPLKQPPALLYLTRLQVRSGGQRAVENLIRSVTDASQKIGAPRKVIVSSTVIGEQGEYFIARPIADPAELDSLKSPAEVLNEAFGEKEAGAILAQSAGVLERITTALARPRPDLSNLK